MEKNGIVSFCKRAQLRSLTVSNHVSSMIQQEGEHLATLAPKHLAEICAIMSAKACLPYAYSWAKLGELCVPDRIFISEVEAELQRLDRSTQAIPWAIGDSYGIREQPPKLTLYQGTIR